MPGIAYAIRWLVATVTSSEVVIGSARNLTMTVDSMAVSITAN